MATSRSGKSKSSGLRILWIPGKRKSHPKGRYEPTNKQVSYHNPQQKKNQLWSLGGNHKHLLPNESDTGLYDGPSVSGVPLTACSLTAVAGVACKPSLKDNVEGTNLPTEAPLTPNSSCSTALLLSTTSSPEPLPQINTQNNDMPAISNSSATNTATAVAEIIKENCFAILSKAEIDEIDVYNLPTPPKDDPNWRDNLRLNASGDTSNNSIATVCSTSPNSDTKSNTSSISPTKKKPHRNHNANHQGDVNSIESISENEQIPKLDLEWIDELVLEHNSNEILRKTNKPKKKKLHTNAKELDQLDGVKITNKYQKSEPEKLAEKEDDKIVKCLYFTLMCCECSIS